jgi:arylsulfatase A-like enzyme
VVRRPVSQIDLLPTLLDACGLTQPPLRDLTGALIYPRESDFGDAASLWPMLSERQTPDAERVVVSESGVHGYHLMARKGSRKINWYADSGTVEVFDLDEDPNELHDRGEGMHLDDVPEDIRRTMVDVYRRASRFAGRYYGFRENIWRMFT